MEPKRQFTGVFIPVEILDDDRLCPTDKILLAEVDAMRGEDGEGCFASNAHLGKHVRMSAGGVAAALGRLRNYGYIYTAKFDGRRRWLKVKWPGLLSKQIESSLLKESTADHQINRPINRRVNPRLKSTIAEIYAAYPRKVAKPEALKAIAKAADKIDADKLLQLTKRFASAREGSDLQFCPYPATWYNQERYNDDPSTWKPHEPNKTRGKETGRGRGTLMEGRSAQYEGVGRVR
jgi:hypothetical protein